MIRSDQATRVNQEDFRAMIRASLPGNEHQQRHVFLCTLYSESSSFYVFFVKTLFLMPKTVQRGPWRLQICCREAPKVEKPGCTVVV